MALNWQTFRTRALTAAVFVAVMLTGLLWNQWSFLVLFSLIHFGCWWEYLKLIEKIHSITFHPYVKLGWMVLGYGLMLWFCGPHHHINHYGLKENFSLPFSIAGFGLIMAGIFQKTNIRLKPFAIAGLGLVYISLSWGLMLMLYQAKRDSVCFDDRTFILPGNFFPLAIILSIWINDTMAYIVGSLIGKTPLTKISPKKTWEGTVGGIILCIAAMAFLFPLIMTGATNYQLGIVIAFVAGISAVSGTFGDLFESKLKRLAGVKDSGQIMPGHGGFLDRFDSLLFAVPAVWVFLLFLLFF